MIDWRWLFTTNQVVFPKKRVVVIVIFTQVNRFIRDLNGTFNRHEIIDGNAILTADEENLVRVYLVSVVKQIVIKKQLIRGNKAFFSKDRVLI